MKNRKTVPQSEEITCPKCGRHNPSWYASCERCGSRLSLSSTGQPLPVGTGRLEKRPGCLTVYAALMGLGAALIILGGLLYGFLSMSNRTMNVPVGFAFIITSMLIGGFNYTVSDGLMKQKNWARLAVLIVQSIGIAVSLLVVCAGVNAYGLQDALMGGICQTFISVSISAYIIYWFAKNKKYFR